MSSTESQYAFRAQKSVGMVDGCPEFDVCSSLPVEAGSAKVYRYSPSGKQFAYVMGSTIKIVSLTGSARRSIEVPSVIDIAFSPLGSYLFTWERLVKVEDGQPAHRNLKVWWIGKEEENGEDHIREAAGFSQKSFDGWAPQVTGDETYMVRLSGPSEISIFALQPLPTNPEDTSVKALADLAGLSSPISKVRTDNTIRGLTLGPAKRFGNGPGEVDTLAGGLAVWMGEYKGQPASVSIYTLRSLRDIKNCNLPITPARKSFYKGDKVVVKWNRIGTMAMFLTQSDVDNSGKSYYGETNLYLIALSGQFDCKVDLDKEGPIHDYAWHPNSREFTVCYGYMPARTVTFDIKANPIHSFEPKSRNFISYQPQGRLMIIAGFGNLSGTVDVYDLQSKQKVTEFQASNSTCCEWSPDGKYILTGTLSPRLRVDNGVKIWWCAGQLLHVELIDELYQVSWRPGPVESFAPFPSQIPPAPEAHASVAKFGPASKKTASGTDGAPAKPAGAYRPPGARGTATPSAYKREDGDVASTPPGASSPAYVPGTRTPRSRHVPGAPPGAQNYQKTNGAGGKKGKKNGANGQAPAATPTPAPEMTGLEVFNLDGDADATHKKIRNLNKKLKAITELVERKNKGETLEATQLKKIEGESAIQKELRTLEASLKK